MKTTVWTCCTSLVLRVMSEAVPKRLISTCENVSTLPKMAPRTSRPKPIATLAPQYTAMMAAALRSRVTPTMTKPVRMMKSVSPVAMPWSMISAFRSGR